MIEIISGTNRPGSNSRKVAAQILEIYKRHNAAARIFDIAEIPAEIFSPASYTEKPASFAPFSQRILDAKGLHIITPEYNGSFPGVLKYFIDMLPFPESFEHKPVAFTGISAGMWGALRAVEQLEPIFGYRDAHIFPARVFIPGIFNELNESGKIKSAELVQRLEKQAGGFVDFVKRIG
ncbi:chromate reductase [Ereboglobus sp. PH5-10]|uniref:NADPH-dependent FMN reductase n=1 Tax=Ereboglobus sp. PH5-10 TaxID=2940629 RepID=UPI002406DC10|nr:NAD(P)H-dependent oxidoreductase [Ereboglobus sp. PH5-10]MDF9827749.1 chromate reductase [Ereboglobus sp. PH5-10]